jgi:EpsD family peptidyl-prolyl cis-trans isomerase
MHTPLHSPDGAIAGSAAPLRNQMPAYKALAFLSAAVLALQGCGDKEPKATQVAAKVNGDEITVHQVNQAMQRAGNLTEAQVPQAQKQILDRLVDQQLLVQQAVDKKLDRDAHVVQAIEAARRQILAQAYVERVMGGAGKAQDAQVKEFFDSHPELFSERRIYRFTQVAIAAPADRHAEIRTKLEELDKQQDKQRILPQLADWLKRQNLQFRATQSTQAAEQLPLEALPKYQKLNLGDLMFSAGAQGAVVSQLSGVQTQPLTEEQAKPFIEQFLQNRERLKLSEGEMKRLRAAAKIEYVGEFAMLEQGAPQAAPAASAPTGEGTSTAPQKSDQGDGEKGVK